MHKVHSDNSGLDENRNLLMCKKFKICNETTEWKTISMTGALGASLHNIKHIPTFHFTTVESGPVQLIRYAGLPLGLRAPVHEIVFHLVPMNDMKQRFIAFT